MAEGDAPARNRLEAFMKGVRAQLFQAVQRVLAGVERQRRGMLGQLVAVEVGGIFFLQVAAVGQQNGAQIAGARRAMDGLGVAALGQQGQVATVVQVGVREHHGVDLVGRDRQGLPVAQA